MGMGWDWGLPQTGAWACRVCECTAPYTAACGRGWWVCVSVCVWTCLDCGGREGVREERDEEGDGTGDPRRTGRWDFDLRLRLHLDLDWAGALGDLDLGVSAGVFARGGRQLCT